MVGRGRRAGRPLGKLIKTGIDIAFQDQVRDLVKPGTSALFLMLEKVIPDKAAPTSRARVDTLRRPGVQRACGQPEGGWRAMEGVAADVEAAHVEECLDPPGRWS